MVITSRARMRLVVDFFSKMFFLEKAVGEL